MGNVTIDLDNKIVKFIQNEQVEVNVAEKIREIVTYILQDQNITNENIYVTIESASKARIRKINHEYRNIDQATDVLSFPIFSREEIQQIRVEENKEKMLTEIELGDIILCLDIIKEHSIEYQTGILRETLYMITHGMCHLLGYDHIINTEKVEMRKLEEKILDKIGVNKINE